MTAEAVNINDALVQEQTALKAAVDGGNWEALTAEAFPIFSSKQPRPFYLARYGMINAEIQSLSQGPAVGLMDEASQSTLRGRMIELGAAASETIKLLYPNVKPVPQETFPVTPDTIETIEAFVANGAIDQLNEESIPGWDNLAADQRLLYRLSALQTYYDKWQDSANNDSLNEIAPLGFTSTPDSLVRRVKNVTEVVQEKIIERHLTEWLKEAEELGLNDNPTVQTAKKLLDSKNK
ncbi:MAG: hypothetical protein HYV90_00730 [Candidatus Woesebacteria bacterium]|nr:MAG: hypothetical protein HYV90_00730 [Candidatus Woesebacteria bacterium]